MKLVSPKGDNNKVEITGITKLLCHYESQLIGIANDNLILYIQLCEVDFIDTRWQWQ